MPGAGIKWIDFIPAVSGLIGKTALVTSFAYVWAQELSITSPGFVFENVRIEMMIGCLITLVAALLLPDTAPSGTLAPLIVLIPTMVNFGVHPLILSILVGIFGMISVKTGLFHKLLSLSGNLSKTSITLTFGISGIILSIKNLITYFDSKLSILIMILVILTLLYMVLLKLQLNWLMIPASAVVSVSISILFGKGIDLFASTSFPHFNPFYWWNDMWGIGFGFNGITIIKTIPFALFVILMWAIDTGSIQTMIDASYDKDEDKAHIDLNTSFIISSLRNMFGGISGGSQTSALWRSFLIPLFMVKRPIYYSSLLLGILGILAGITAVPIKMLSFPPLIWTVLLFGIFLPFTVVSLKNTSLMKHKLSKGFILIFSGIGIFSSPILTWICAILYEKVFQFRNSK
ncbi:MAG: hypothetical protein K0S47_2902 [Herbinix sp.]|nr:hypothetical protein [Herbinix sp.]